MGLFAGRKQRFDEPVHRENILPERNGMSLKGYDRSNKNYEEITGDYNYAID